jgi:metal-responsive CopG/Arc/MetJ family transcriptional regulator
MADRPIVLKLNQQQMELLDRTVAQGLAPDRTHLVRLALKEYAAQHRNGADILRASAKKAPK